jgi:hypothetical protein
VRGELMDTPPEKIAAVDRADYGRWLKVIKDAGIHLD